MTFVFVDVVVARTLAANELTLLKAGRFTAIQFSLLVMWFGCQLTWLFHIFSTYVGIVMHVQKFATLSLLFQLLHKFACFITLINLLASSHSNTSSITTMKHSSEYTSSPSNNVAATGFRDSPSRRDDISDRKRKPRRKSSSAARAKSARTKALSAAAVAGKQFNVYQQPWQTLRPNDAKVRDMAAVALGSTTALPVDNPTLLLRSALSLYDANELKFICSQLRIDEFPDDSDALKHLIINNMINHGVMEATVPTVAAAVTTVTPDSEKSERERLVTFLTLD